MLKDRDVEVVHVCTPNFLHYAMVKQVIAAGRHVVCEKPLALTSKESKELVGLAKKARLVNAVDFNYRMYPLVQQARRMVESGQVGRIYSAHGSYLQDWLYLETDWNWRLEPERSGESRAVADIGSHWCDLVQFIASERITAVLGDMRTIHKTRRRPKVEVATYAGKKLRPSDYTTQRIDTEDYASVLFELSGGAHGVFTVSQVSAGRKNRLYYEIDGSKCALAWDQERPEELWIGRREKASEMLVKDGSIMDPRAAAYAHFPGGHPEGYPDGPKNLFGNVYAHIARGGRGEADYPTFEDGHCEIAICEAILRSARTERWTKVVC
jgi:predicted dehydrogenase